VNVLLSRDFGNFSLASLFKTYECVGVAVYVFDVEKVLHMLDCNRSSQWHFSASGSCRSQHENGSSNISTNSASNKESVCVASFAFREGLVL
jgi:hypothetical protein